MWAKTGICRYCERTNSTSDLFCTMHFFKTNFLTYYSLISCPSSWQHLFWGRCYYLQFIDWKTEIAHAHAVVVAGLARHLVAFLAKPHVGGLCSFSSPSNDLLKKIIDAYVTGTVLGITWETNVKLSFENMYMWNCLQNGILLVICTVEHIERGHQDAQDCVVGPKYIWIRRQGRSVGAWGSQGTPSSPRWMDGGFIGRT